MSTLYTAFRVESLKALRSGAFKITIFLFAFISAMMCLPVFVAKYPDLSQKLGMMGNKAALMSAGTPGWPNFTELLLQGIAGVGFVGVGFVASWIYGREFSDRTVKDLLALPISRTQIIFAKFLVTVWWSLLLAAIYLLAALGIGILLDLPGGSPALVSALLYRFWTTALLTLLLATPIAFLASYSKGVLLPVGVTILTMIMANLSAMVGLATYFPWAIPGMYAVGESAGIHLTATSYTVLLITGVAGAWGTWHVWIKSDQL